VAYPDDVQRIRLRSALAGVEVSAGQAAALAGYLEVLRRWNRKSNLTAFELTPPSDAAIDRLIAEPVAAAGHVPEAARLLVDIGSGGGSPAIPLRVMAPQVRVLMVEARARKAAFLREVVRALGLSGVDVENCRFEELAGRSELQGAADVVTVRAVRTTGQFWSNTIKLLTSGGAAFLFGTQDEAGELNLPVDLRLSRSEPLVPALASRLHIIKRPD
jgi:16S rRNA (guanine527-N7)-methyltransferase